MRLSEALGRWEALVNVELGSTRALHDGAQITLAPSRVGTATITLHRGGVADSHVHLTPAEARQVGADLVALAEHVARVSKPAKAVP
jgi:hypothetical protein